MFVGLSVYNALRAYLNLQARNFESEELWEIQFLVVQSVALV